VGPVESEFDFCARRAAEEFIAAGRAETETERRAHRDLAESYSAIVRLLISRRPELMPIATALNPGKDAAAA